MRQQLTIVLLWMMGAVQHQPAFSKQGYRQSAMISWADVVINEILFNPTANGAEYIELYNRGDSMVNLADIYIATRNLNGAIGTKYAICKQTKLLYPQSYAVVTKDSAAIERNYFIKQPNALVVVNSLPRLNNQEGSVLLVTQYGSIIDELHYWEEWHFSLLGSKIGVALERINYNLPTQDASNWHSASSTVGFGTPTYQNSQFRINDSLKGKINLSPQVLSPNNDGYDDVATISFLFEEPGTVCTVNVYDANGQLVKNWVRNALCGIKNFYTWDGLNNNHQPLPVGVYIVYAEVFTLKGKIKKFKQAITLIRKL
jgi:hypothetical protein